VLNSPTVNDLHARLYRSTDGDFFLADQGSIAGTWINFAPITINGARLEHGDLIHIGRMMFRFELAQPTQAQIKVIDLEQMP
jgi:predicted component of type VI protein secretion system